MRIIFAIRHDSNSFVLEVLTIDFAGSVAFATRTLDLKSHEDATNIHGENEDNRREGIFATGQRRTLSCAIKIRGDNPRRYRSLVGSCRPPFPLPPTVTRFMRRARAPFTSDYLLAVLAMYTSHVYFKEDTLAKFRLQNERERENGLIKGNKKLSSRLARDCR